MRRSSKIQLGLLLVAIAALPVMFHSPAHTATKYSGGAVTDGGSVSGTVRFSGAVPPAKTTAVDKDHGVCGQSQKSQELVVGGGGGLKNAVVYISKIKKGKPAKKTVKVLNQEGCVYVPHVQAAVKGSRLQLKSKDEILHNVHAKLNGKRVMFNVALPSTKQVVTKKLRKTGLYDITCDAGHHWMQAYTLVFKHPYFAVTGESGRFSLGDIPPGKYKLVVWHEKLGKKRTTITIPANGHAAADFEYP